jgi:hypothetical protein
MSYAVGQTVEVCLEFDVSGFDRVIADRADLVAADCEKVVVVHGSREDINRQVDRFAASLPQAQREFFGNFFEEQLAPFPGD